mmetsp:Transcript_39245/g.91818  ORF Transcript_39245/g.91818 Transcript_39245/m.91818 type:complete len:88 (+) Transcript_39245:109-372(+)
MPGMRVQLTLRYALALSSMFCGASVVHWYYKPDLTVPMQPSSSAPAPSEVEGFSASPQFSGKRGGFVFKMGPAGLGYYPDGKQEKCP